MIESTPTTACPTCGDDVIQPRIGRPKVFCSDGCRYEMRQLRTEFKSTEQELAEAEQLARNAHNDHWRQYHERRVGWLRGAVAEARMRLSDPPEAA